MLPTFGSDIPDTVFEPNDVALTAELSTSAREAIEVWDDRIEFISFSAEPDPDRNSLKLKIEWRFAQDPLEARTRVTSVEVTPALMGALL
jgi:phage baseplate assembly protein W